MRHVARAGDGEPGADRAHPDAHAAHAARAPRQDLRDALGQRLQVCMSRGTWNLPYLRTNKPPVVPLVTSDKKYNICMD